MRLTGWTGYLRVLAYQKGAPRHAGAWLRCRWRAFDRLRALRNPERQAGTQELAPSTEHRNCRGKTEWALETLKRGLRSHI
jgi:hypothetical protein